MARKATGQLIWRPSGWYARYWTTIDGERVRVCRALGTANKVVAKRKLTKLLEAAEHGELTDPKAAETFEEAAERVYEGRIADRDEDRAQREELSMLRRYAFEAIGHLAVDSVKPSDVNAVLDAGKDAGLSRQSVQHLRQRMSNVFAILEREGAVVRNPVSSATMPRFGTVLQRERAVLTDHELAVYLAWEHPIERFQGAVRERQTMACVARMFGGLRTGDLHALRWDAFETEGGRFGWGYAPRRKTKRPQLLEVPEQLRPFLRDWWERAGRPSEGLVFPVRRVGKRGDRIGQERRHVTHAAAFRRDLKAAFRAATAKGIEAPRGPAEPDGPDEAGDARWRQLFSDAEPYTRPVDFHSWRRAYVQALANADVNAQQAAALAGHANLAAHARYLVNAGAMRTLPAAALPALQVDERALAKGIELENEPAVNGSADSVPVIADDFDPMQAPVLTVTPEVAGSSPVRPAKEASQTQAVSEPEHEAAPEQKAPALPNDGPDPVEVALADAITRAAQAGEWDAVQSLTAELQARRLARAGTVDLASERAKRGRS